MYGRGDYRYNKRDNEQRKQQKTKKGFDDTVVPVDGPHSENKQC
jgi:hypothetical protein